MSDLIDRQVAIEAMSAVNDSICEQQAIDALCDLPSAQPERKKGKWMIEPDRTVMHCNVCGWAFEYYAGLEEEWDFCPHCGAKMGGERDARD